jgi:hypothetical protein
MRFDSLLGLKHSQEINRFYAVVTFLQNITFRAHLNVSSKMMHADLRRLIRILCVQRMEVTTL